MMCLKRAYEPAVPDDGLRILVEWLWPGRLSKAKAGLDLWLKELAPSPDPSYRKATNDVLDDGMMQASVRL